MGICPECNEDLACSCLSCVGRERGRLKEITDKDIIECPKCGYKNHIDHWMDFDFFLATCGGLFEIGSNWESKEDMG